MAYVTCALSLHKVLGIIVLQIVAVRKIGQVVKVTNKHNIPKIKVDIIKKLFIIEVFNNPIYIIKYKKNYILFKIKIINIYITFVNNG